MAWVDAAGARLSDHTLLQSTKVQSLPLANIFHLGSSDVTDQQDPVKRLWGTLRITRLTRRRDGLYYAQYDAGQHFGAEAEIG
jgi:hypothetical protein